MAGRNVRQGGTWAKCALTVRHRREALIHPSVGQTIVFGERSSKYLFIWMVTLWSVRCIFAIASMKEEYVETNRFDDGCSNGDGAL